MSAMNPQHGTTRRDSWMSVGMVVACIVSIAVVDQHHRRQPAAVTNHNARHHWLYQWRQTEVGHILSSDIKGATSGGRDRIKPMTNKRRQQPTFRGDQQRRVNEDEEDEDEGDHEDEDDRDNNEEEQEKEGEDQADAEDDFYKEGESRDQQVDDDDDMYDVDDDAQQAEFQTEAPVYIDDDFYSYQEDPGPPKLFPLTSRDVIAFFFVSITLTLSASGGMGGGGIVVPTYVMVMGLTTKAAIPLGAITVLGGSMASMCVNGSRRHPLADRPIIDWDLVLVTEPLILIGALMGTLLHRVLAEKFLLVLLVLLLSVSAHSTLAKAKRMYDAESKYIKKLKAVHHPDVHHVAPPLSPPRPSIVFPATDARAPPIEVASVPLQQLSSPAKPPSLSSLRTEPRSVSEPSKVVSFMQQNPIDLKNISSPAVGVDTDDLTNNSVLDEEALKLAKTKSEGSMSATRRPLGVEERQQILILNPDFITLRSGLLEEEKFTPRTKVIALMAMFSILMFLNIMVGGNDFQSPWGIQCGSVSYWIVQVIMVSFLVASAWAAQTYVVNRHGIKEIVRFDYVHGDIKWDARSAIIYPALFIATGAFAGMFGIGGGMVTVPLMLQMGVHPAVVSATSSAQILFTSFASTTSYLVFGLLLYDYAWVCLLVGFCASFCGQKIMRQARQARSANGRNFERNSYIAFCIGIVILVSALLMTIDYVFRLYSYNVSEPMGLCEGYRI